MRRVGIMKARCPTNQRQKKPNYTREFKQDAVKLVLEQGYPCGGVAQRLGIAGSNVTRWVRLHQSDRPENTPPDPYTTFDYRSTSDRYASADLSAAHM